MPELNQKYLARFLSPKIQKWDASQQTRQMNLVRPNLACQCSYSHKQAILSYIY